MLILDRYKPTYEAGSGGFATVIVAWDTRIQREVAIKCLPLEDAATREVSSESINEALRNMQNPYADPDDPDNASVSILLESEFDALSQRTPIPGLEEARTAALLNDPNIASIYDFEIQGNTAYIIMELVDGISLSDLMRFFPDELDADVVAAVFKGVSHALEVAHKNHVLHLDVKPDNVLINARGQVKVVDFGLARLADGFGFGVATGGTIGYMPPEQMEREELDERCDQWALASLTYEMIAGGENPFRARSIDEALEAIYDAEIVIPSLCMADIGEGADDAIFRALDPDSEGRYPSIHAFARDMKSALGNPKQGSKKLAQIVSEAVGTDAEDDDTDMFEESDLDQDKEFEGGYPLNASGRWRSERRSKSWRARRSESMLVEDDDETVETPVRSRYSIVLRILAAIGCTLVSSVAFSNFSLLPGWESPALWGALLIVVVAAFAVPHVGALISFSLFGLALVNNAAFLVGAIVVVATFVWWFCIGRAGTSEADAALLSVASSSIGLGSLTPLVSAYFLRPGHAILTTIFVTLLSVVLAGLGSISITSWNLFQFGNIHLWTEVNANILATLQNVMTWAIIASWLISTPIASLCFSRRTLASNLIGIALTTAITCLLPAVASTFILAHDPDPIYVLLTISAGMIMALITILFPPRQEQI